MTEPGPAQISAPSLVRWPHPALRQRADEVAEIDAEVHDIWARMIDVMEAMPGYGLAAPQLGIGLRLAVVDASRERGQAVRMANPEIVDASTEPFVFQEASPNLPGVSALISRPKQVIVAFTDPAGMRVRQTFEGLWATSVQHQIDHLEGRMYFDRLSRTKRSMLLKKAGKRS